MKKYLALLLAMVLTLALCACASAQVQQTEPAKQEDAESALPQEQPESEEQKVESSGKMVTVNGFTYDDTAFHAEDAANSRQLWRRKSVYQSDGLSLFPRLLRSGRA